MRIGYIHATNHHDSHCWPSLAFGYLKSYLHKHIGDAVSMERVTAHGPQKFDVIAISAASQDYNQAKWIARKVKEQSPSVLVVLGGSHVTWLPETMTQDFDFGVMGEGEQTFLELVMVLMDGGGHHLINGMAGHDGRGGWGINPPRQPIEPLDLIPPPHRDQCDDQHIFTSRGCPYRCRFCSSSAFWGKTRFHSAEYVVDEIEHLVSTGTKYIPFMDDLFILDRKRFVNIMEGIRRRGLDRKFGTKISVRTNLVDDELCTLIKEFPQIGSVHFGVESGSDRILKLIGKGVTVAQNQEAIDRLHAAGIQMGHSYIVGWPSETEEELMTTIEFVQRNILEGKSDHISPLNILTPHPGTEVWNDAVRTGQIDVATFDWGRLGIFASHWASRVKNFDAWLDVRRKNDSIYLNEDSVPQERLYEILREHEIAVVDIVREG